MMRRCLLLFALPLSLCLSTATVHADDSDAAAEIARSETGGRVLSVTPHPDSTGYIVKILLDDGRVRTLHIDPR